MGEKELEFTAEDEETLVMFASQAALVTATEYRMLVELSANAGLPLTHKDLLHLVWGPDIGEDSGPVRNVVRRLRSELGDDPDDPTYIFAFPRSVTTWRRGREQGRQRSREGRERRRKVWSATAFAGRRGVAPDRMSSQPVLDLP